MKTYKVTNITYLYGAITHKQKPKIMTVSFQFTQILQTHYPGLEITVVFSGEALVKGEEVQIYSVHDNHSIECRYLDIPKGYESQNQATGEMGFFLGMCRDAARQAAHELERRQQAQESFEELAPNGGFVPSASDISYMNDDDDISFPKI